MLSKALSRSAPENRLGVQPANRKAPKPSLHYSAKSSDQPSSVENLAEEEVCYGYFNKLLESETNP